MTVGGGGVGPRKNGAVAVKAVWDGGGPGGGGPGGGVPECGRSGWGRSGCGRSDWVRSVVELVRVEAVPVGAVRGGGGPRWGWSKFFRGLVSVVWAFLFSDNCAKHTSLEFSGRLVKPRLKNVASDNKLCLKRHLFCTQR